MAYMNKSSAFTPGNVTTGSAYNTLDAVGNSFGITGVAGERGAINRNVTLFDHATGNGNLRLHLFAASFASASDGDQFEIADGDEQHYLGYVDFTTWVSAGTAKTVSQAKASDVDFFTQSGSRIAYGQFEARAAITFGDSANPLRGWVTHLEDG